MECRKVFSTAHVSNSVTFDMYNNIYKFFMVSKGLFLYGKLGRGLGVNKKSVLDLLHSSMLTD